MNKNYSYQTTMYKSMMTQMYVFLVLYIIFAFYHEITFKDTDSTEAKRGLVFIGLMTPNGAIWSRYQRTFLMR